MTIDDYYNEPRVILCALEIQEQTEWYVLHYIAFIKTSPFFHYTISCKVTDN